MGEENSYDNNDTARSVLKPDESAIPLESDGRNMGPNTPDRQHARSS